MSAAGFIPSVPSTIPSSLRQRAWSFVVVCMIQAGARGLSCAERREAMATGKGKAKQVKGKVQETVGKVTGDKGQQAKGRGEQITGKAEELTEEARRHGKN